MATRCIVCDEEIHGHGRGVSVVKEKGIKSLEKASIERADGKSSSFSGLTSLLIHSECRKNYTRPQSIDANNLKRLSSETASEPTEPILRSKKLKFDFKTKCFLCAESVDGEEKKPKERRKRILRVANIRKGCHKTNIQETILLAAQTRHDQWGDEVLSRIISINDLVAEEAIYHDECRLEFVRVLYSKSSPISTDQSLYVSKAVEEVTNLLEGNSDSQFTVDEIMGVITGVKPTWRTLKLELIKKYGDQILFIDGSNRFRVPIVCFRDTGHRLLSNNWYDKRENDEEEERLRIVKKAAEIIRQDIQSVMYNNNSYPPRDDFLKDADSLPKSLQNFLEEVMLKTTKKTEETKKKCIAIGHAIISVVRPRTFLSSILIGISLLLHRKFASKSLINLLASLGFSSSYYEAQKLELSAISHAQLTYKSAAFKQIVFDNVDFNVCTMDGLNTFHAMGGIECITPSKHIEKSTEIPRLNTMPTCTEIGKLGFVPLETYQEIKGGLRNVNVAPISIPEEQSHPAPHNILWFVAKKKRIAIPDWKGYMHCITRGKVSEKTRVITLPFINAPPSEYDTVFTALRSACKLSDKTNQKHIFITFDQPLYWKARDIVAGATNSSHSELTNCIVRLGGFHLLMSFMGCIGYIMMGAGLKEALSTIFAPLSVEKMLNGHAFARAVRGHFLVQTSLSNIILDMVELSQEEEACMKNLTSDFSSEPPSLEFLNTNKSLKSISIKFGEAMEKIRKNGPTATLWIQYFNMVNLMKDFIHAERSGDFHAHLNCCKMMIPYFHAAGHFPYAKSCQLYVQDMEKLCDVLTPEEYEKFVSRGYFTMRTNDQFWSGMWSDMTIETTLMRSFKSRGGMTHGRGMTDSALSKWVTGMTATQDICASLEEYCSVSFSSSEQHKDFGEARQKRNERDVCKLTHWFDNHSPFPKNEKIISIATGIIGDNTVLCHDAVRVGRKAMEKIENLPFTSIKLTRKDCALPLSIMNSTMKIHDEKVVVDPLLLFQRICITKKSDEDLKNYMKYELAPYPLALFDGCGMRKSRKSSLYTLMKGLDGEVDLSTFEFVVDGGFLIHKVVWQRDSTLSIICDNYATFLKTHYCGKGCTVVFDGYTSMESTKVAEQSRRYQLKRCVDINVNLESKISVKQEDFLSNVHNKSQLINLLIMKLQESGINTFQAQGDADVDIVKIAINLSVHSSVVVIGEDIDLAVLLVAKTPTNRDILLMKPGRGKVKTEVYSSKSLQIELKMIDNAHLLFLHAFTGCDTTSAAYNKSKVGFVKLYRKSKIIQHAAEVFVNNFSSPDSIESAGVMSALSWYGAPTAEQSLNSFRYKSFVKAAANMRPNLSTLPPSEGAMKQHSNRTYHQVHLWLEREPDGGALNWGWEKKNDILVPRHSELEAAPEEILKTFFCRCTKGCDSGRCGCRRASLNCSIACLNCKGSCKNGVEVLIHDEEDDEDDIIQ